MAVEKSNKPIIVDISSSDESNSPPSDSDFDAAEVICSSTSCDDDIDDDFDWRERNYSQDENKAKLRGHDDWHSDDVDKPNAESMCNKVIHFIRGGSDMQELRLDECKAYLRRHNLRLSGNKEECIARIEEHWKLKDGSGEVFYPRRSFIINCTGDVCQGDTVLFHQKVHRMSGERARRTTGRRTVAGRVIKESYGATRQQHTFTVEVLWSRGDKKLDPLFPLLVKGRNLYRMKTCRQLWKNEKERVEVLSEKHRRGDAARAVRATRRNKAVMRKNESLALKGPSKTRETSHGKNSLNAHRDSVKSKERHHFSRFSSKQNAGSRVSAPHRRHHYSPNHGRQSPSPYYHEPAQTFFTTEAHNFYSHGGFSSITGFPYSRPLPY
ncbi:zinc finger CCCH domain-containing protein 62-like [Salvia splendens]|uniref:zinc finger CCCH domain-containing protein 62-like n=1 Tax=Salvia splendens TaxID=180675 RepID=UPI001C26B55A|nr:zinc finger CCCH domain-containing protein 62-like [Salvia splendens]